MKLQLAILIFFIPIFSFAQSFRGSSFSGANIHGLNGSVGFGFAEFNVKSPSSQFRMDNGVYVYVGGEKSVTSALFVTISFNYMTTKGQSFYNYSTLGGVTYTNTTPEISFDSTNYQLGLGLKYKIFPHNWFRPYIEGGGLFGYHEIKHDVSTSNTTCGGCGNPAGFQAKDTLSGFGYYGEGGVEIDFSDSYGVRVGGRYQETETRAFETLANQKLKFSTLIFQFALQKHF